MNRIVCLLFVVVLLCPSSSHAARIYNIIDYPLLQEGHTLTGTITTTDDAPLDSMLDVAEILDWQWSITGPNILSAADTPPPTSGSPTTFADGISISSLTIELPLATQTDLRLWQITPKSRGLLRALRWSTSDPGLDGIYSSNNNAGRRDGDVPLEFWSSEIANPDGASWVIANAVPEPSSLLLFILCLLAPFPLGRRCVVE